MNDDQRSKFEGQARSVGRKSIPPEWRTEILDAALVGGEAQGAAREDVVEIVAPETTGDVGMWEVRIRNAERRAKWSMAACLAMTLMLIVLLSRRGSDSGQVQRWMEEGSARSFRTGDWDSGEETGADDPGIAIPDTRTKQSSPISRPTPASEVTASAAPDQQPARGFVALTDGSSSGNFAMPASVEAKKDAGGQGQEAKGNAHEGLTALSEALRESDKLLERSVKIAPTGLLASNEDAIAAGSRGGGRQLEEANRDLSALRHSWHYQGGSSMVDEAPDDRPSPVETAPYTPLGTLTAQPSLTVTGVTPNLDWNIEYREDYEADHPGNRPASIPMNRGRAIDELSLAGEDETAESAPQRSIGKKRSFVIAAHPLSNETEEVRYRIDTKDSAGDRETTREIGMTLAVTPSVLPDGTIRMKMRPRTAQVVDEVIGQSGNRYPASEALLETFASIPPGHSMLVGGFYGQAKRKGGNKVPLLGDIPEINFFLKGAEAIEEDPSLLFVVMPTIRQNETGGNQVSVDTKVLKVNDGVSEGLDVGWRAGLGAAGLPPESVQRLDSLLGIEGPGQGASGSPLAGDGPIVLSAEQTEGVLRTLSDAGLAKQFSNPTLITEDNEVATLSLVDRVPIITTTLNEAADVEQVKKREAPKDLEKDAAAEPWSTFSLNVSDVSFKLAKAALARGEWPAPVEVRVEEFVNAFDYGDPSPRQDEKVACHLEQAVHPFLQQRNLLRVSMRTAALGRAAGTPLRLTVLLDNSGSMERADRVESVKNAFHLLAAQLHPEDRVTLIGFARTPRLLADRLAGDRVAELVEVVESTPSRGGTNLELALELAVAKAKEQLPEGGQNRIILMTDGAANLGNARPEDLAMLVENMRRSGIAFDACGVGSDGLNDEILESLTRKGDGRYYFLDRPEDADGGFARQIAGALRPAARNVKVQVRFNPDRVGRYKLFGFEKHLLNKEDFRDDNVDAAELAAEEAGNAIYQVQLLPEGRGEIGTVAVRFQDTESGQMFEREWTIPYEARAPRLEDAAASLRLASGAALLGEKLKGSLIGESVEMALLGRLVNGLTRDFPSDQRVGDLVKMTNQARELSGE